MEVDKQYCMSSYLMYRYVYDKDKSFQKDVRCQVENMTFPRVPVRTAEELLAAIKSRIEAACQDEKAVLALSGGMDSAILAKFMPEGAKAYTFRCIVPGKRVQDETCFAAHWAQVCGLEHEVVDIYWEDIADASKILMRYKGAPIHSIEAQIYLAAKKAKEDGAERFIFGENADIIYGGMNGLLAKDWLYAEFVERYTYIMPYRVLREPKMPLAPFHEFEFNGYIDGYDFTNKYFRQEALGTYQNACRAAGIALTVPYAETYLDEPIDYVRIRSGDTKYIIREAFKILYPQEKVPEKIPMPRPMDEWLAKWDGPKRSEFLPHCTDIMTGDQKWMVWSLEEYLNLIEG